MELCTIPAPLLAKLKSRASSLLALTPRLKIIFVDGFLLYGPSVAVLKPFFDVRIFLRASYKRVKARRQHRERRCLQSLKGFWADPPGYVDKVVWPNYLKAYSWLFENGDVEGKFRDEVLHAEHIDALRNRPVDVDIVETLSWAVDTILCEICPNTKVD
jgi:nicotinamide/nicotinate riboside kinase